ncbi:MAG: flotillin family protein [Planctomycetota bacterium]
MLGWFDEPNSLLLVLIVAVVLTALGFLVFLAKRYKRCPSNRVLVVYGKVGADRSAKCLHGGGTFVLPLIQNYSFMSLDPLQIEIPLTGALSAENIRINVPSVFTVAIGTQETIMHNAAERLLGLTTTEIGQQARDIIFGQLRQVIAGMRIEAINRDRDMFLQSIQSSLEPELNKIGLVLLNVNITDIMDESGYIEAIGRKAASEAIQQAEIDVAEQRRHGAIGVAKARREEEIQVAEANKERAVGTANALKNQALSIAEFNRDKQIGEQRAQFQTEAEVKAADRAKRIAIATADAEAVEGENAAKAKIAATNAELRVREAEAYQLSETRKREAEAGVRQAQYLAEAKAAEAESRKVEAEQRALLEAQALAEKAKVVVDAEAAAERRRIHAEAEAKAVFLSLEAQARGEFEQLRAKAEGLRLIVDSCGGAQPAFQMLMLEHLDKLAETAASAIANVKFDKVVCWDGGGNGNGAGGAAGFVRSLGGMLPPVMQIMKDIGGVEMPEFFGKLVEKDGTKAEVANVAAATEAPEGPPAAKSNPTPGKAKA